MAKKFTRQGLFLAFMLPQLYNLYFFFIFSLSFFSFHIFPLFVFPPSYLLPQTRSADIPSLRGEGGFSFNMQQHMIKTLCGQIETYLNSERDFMVPCQISFPNHCDIFCFSRAEEVVWPRRKLSPAIPRWSSYTCFLFSSGVIFCTFSLIIVTYPPPHPTRFLKGHHTPSSLRPPGNKSNIALPFTQFLLVVFSLSPSPPPPSAILFLPSSELYAF